MRHRYSDEIEETRDAMRRMRPVDAAEPKQRCSACGNWCSRYLNMCPTCLPITRALAPPAPGASPEQEGENG